jgi:hypothetical protein
MPSPVPFLKIESAFAEFARAGVNIQSQAHIKPFHQHIALRLVLEGGFHPDEITPHPPLRCETRGGRKRLMFDPAAATTGELTVLGGLKSKDIDVVVTKDKVGPVVAVSVKGATGAFRNLTNRMEEAIGDSTNLHIMYPGLVYGFFHLLRVNRAGEPDIGSNDVSMEADGTVVKSVKRFHEVLLGLTGRRLVRDDFTRYEAVAFAMVETAADRCGALCSTFPPADSPLVPERFFETLYSSYDLRFPFVGNSMPALKRHIWDGDSPAFEALGDPPEAALGYSTRTE